MAFASVAGSVATTAVTDGSSVNINMPASIVAGELLLCYIAGDTNGTIAQSGGSDWSRIDHGSNGTAVQMAIFAKIAAGSDSLTVTFEANDLAAVAFRVQGHGVSDVTTDILVATAATGTSNAPNPPSISFGGMLKEWFVIESFAADDDDNTATYWSSGFSEIGFAESASSTSSCMVAAAGSEVLESSSLDPLNMAMAQSEEWRTQTIAIPPEEAGPVVVTPTTKALILSTFAATVTASDHKTVTPTTAVLSLTEFAPTINIGVNVIPETETLALTTFAPTVEVTNHQLVTPGKVSLVTSVFSPTVFVSNHQSVTPDVRNLTTSTFAPTVSVTDHKVVTPGTASLVVTTFNATVTASDHKIATPGVLSMVLSTFAPTISVGGGGEEPEIRVVRGMGAARHIRRAMQRGR